jgi:hypothetical protein
MICVVCRQLMSAIAAVGGYDRHPGCEDQSPTTELAWRCVNCLAGGLVSSRAEALTELDEHDIDCPGRT